LVCLPQPEKWLGIYRYKNKIIMNDRHLEIQVCNLLDKVNDTIYLLVKKIENMESDLLELEKQHEQSLKVEFEKGYKEGVNYTDGLISEEKRFPF
jgi:hypothetical protein